MQQINNNSETIKKKRDNCLKYRYKILFLQNYSLKTFLKAKTYIYN